MASDDHDLPRIMPRRHPTKQHRSQIRLTYVLLAIVFVAFLAYFYYAPQAELIRNEESVESAKPMPVPSAPADFNRKVQHSGDEIIPSNTPQIVSPSTIPKAAGKQVTPSTVPHVVGEKEEKVPIMSIAPKKSIVVKTEGWTKEILRQGGGTIYPKIGDTVTIDYVGSLLSTGKVFDSSRAPGRGRFVTKVGVGRLIKGWDEAVPTMSVGERCNLTINPEWAYGKGGIGEDIPPNAVLVFDVLII